MAFLIRKNVLPSLTFVILTLGFALVYYDVPYNKYENKRATVGILVPFTLNLNFTNTFSTAIKEFPFQMYRPDGTFRKYDKIVTSKTHSVDERTVHEDFADVVNNLAEKAVKTNMEYLVLYLDDSSLHTIDKDQIQHSVRQLANQTVSNVGVVIVGDINENTSGSQFIAVHKSHMEIFHQFFPDHLNITKAIQWITNVYSPYHISTLNTNRPYSLRQLSVPFKFVNRYRGRDLIKDRNKVNDFIISKRSVFIISYSLFGSNTRYTDGAIANSKLFKTIYPGWKLWIYHDNTVPLHILSQVCKLKDVTCINLIESIFKNRMTWRFLVASVPFVSRYIIRDFDSRLSPREKAAVDEWIVSGKKFHTMRDHPSHGYLPINGGMWGGTREAIPQMEELLKGFIIQDKYMKDMNFLNDSVWKIAKTSVVQHDSFFCDKFPGGRPFPTKRYGLDFVGSVYINGKTSKVNECIINRTKECVHM